MATIMIVDDRPTNRQLLVTLLGYAGHRMLEAADGEQALNLTRAENPDLIITDILMPTMDGYEFVRQLRTDPDFASMPVIFYTATYRDREARSLARAAGVQYVLTKPAEPQAILNMVNAALGHVQASAKPSELITRPIPDPVQVVSSKLTAKMGELDSLGQRLEALIELVLKLSSEREPVRLLEIACDAARVIIGAKYAAIGMLEEGAQTLKQFIVSGIDSETIARIGSLPTGRGILGKRLNEGQPLRLMDIRADPHSVGFPPAHPPMHSFLSVPLASPTGLYGRLYLTEKIGKSEFSEEDEHVSVALAAQVAVAYENAIRYAEIQRIAENLRRSNAELEQFAYVASHDLQEPLRMISSYLQLLVRRYQGKLDSDADEFIAFAVDGAKRMQNLINDLLTYSRLSTQGKPLVLTSCETILDNALTNLRVAIEESNATIMHDPLSAIFCDPTQLVQVFQNLLDNSIKFRGPQVPQIHVSASREESEWMFSVRDNGIGLDPKFGQRIFDIFQRLHSGSSYPGTGIGLAICKRIIQRHGGRIWVQSIPGEGATFYFTLPVKETL